MTPEEQKKADAWLLLHDKDVVTRRIGNVIVEAFKDPETAVWFLNKLVVAERRSLTTPLKSYFEGQLERNLRMILALSLIHI